jgi:hypothetical protein
MPILADEKYQNTYMMMFDIVERPEGMKITRFREFVDSLYSRSVFTRLHEAVSKLGDIQGSA